MTTKQPTFHLILLTIVMLLLAACGAGEAIVERGIGEVVDRTVGEGTMATAEAAMEDIQEGIEAQEAAQQELDTDGDGEVSEDEQQQMLDEPGSFITNPIDLTLGTPVADSLIQGTLGRHYRAKLPAGAITTVQFTNQGDTDIFFSVSGVSTDLPESVPGGETVETTFIVGEATDMTLSALMILGTSDFELLVSAETQNDGASGGDAGPSAEPANIEAATGLSGQLGGRDTEDAFRVRVPAKQAVEVTLTSDSDNVDTLTFYIESTAGYFNETKPILPGNSATLISAEVDEYFATIVVRGESSGGSYALDIVTTPEDDGGSGADVSELHNAAMAIGLGQAVRGTSLAGDSDCYTLALAAGQGFQLDVTVPSEQVYEVSAGVDVYDGADGWLGSVSAELGVDGSQTFEAATDGDYVFCAAASSYYPYSVYEFTVSAAQ